MPQLRTAYLLVSAGRPVAGGWVLASMRDLTVPQDTLILLVCDRVDRQPLVAEETRLLHDCQVEFGAGDASALPFRICRPDDADRADTMERVLVGALDELHGRLAVEGEPGSAWLVIVRHPAAPPFPRFDNRLHQLLQEADASNVRVLDCPWWTPTQLHNSHPAHPAQHPHQPPPGTVTDLHQHMITERLAPKFHALFEKCVRQCLRVMHGLPDQSVFCAGHWTAAMSLEYLPFASLLLFNHFVRQGVLVRGHSAVQPRPGSSSLSSSDGRRRIVHLLQRLQVDQLLHFADLMDAQSQSVTISGNTVTIPPPPMAFPPPRHQAQPPPTVIKTLAGSASAEKERQKEERSRRVAALKRNFFQTEFAAFIERTRDTLHRLHRRHAISASHKDDGGGDGKASTKLDRLVAQFPHTLLSAGLSCTRRTETISSPSPSSSGTAQWSGTASVRCGSGGADISLRAAGRFVAAGDAREDAARLTLRLMHSLLDAPPLFTADADDDLVSAPSGNSKRQLDTLEKVDNNDQDTATSTTTISAAKRQSTAAGTKTAVQLLNEYMQKARQPPPQFTFEPVVCAAGNSATLANTAASVYALCTVYGRQFKSVAAYVRRPDAKEDVCLCVVHALAGTITNNTGGRQQEEEGELGTVRLLTFTAQDLDTTS